MTKEINVKIAIRNFLEGKFVTILMSLVTIFALVGVSIFFNISKGRYQTMDHKQVS